MSHDPVKHGTRLISEVIWEANSTWGLLSVRVGNVDVWNGLEWDLVDLLSHLAHHWTWLVWRDGLPDGSPEQVDKWVRARECEHGDEFSNQLWEFVVAHDLGGAFDGALVTPLWLLRRGALFEVTHDGGRSYHPVVELLNDLGALGDAIAERVRLHREDCEDVLSRWENRHAVSGDAIELATGRSEAWLRESGVEPTQILREARGKPWTSAPLAFARMVGGVLDASSLKLVFEALARRPKGGPSRRLQSLTRDAESLLEPGDLPYEQGYRLGRWLRRIWDIDGRADPESVLSQLGVDVLELDLRTNALDGLASWTKGLRPVVLWNESSVRPRRATLAHELAHLLVDRRQALPVGEVLGGVVVEYVEQRANAFAAEFLIPREDALLTARLEGWNARRVVERLRNTHDVSVTMTAHQLLNATTERSGWSQSDRAWLESLVNRADDVEKHTGTRFLGSELELDLEPDS
ncbi:MAG: ImmA/IrrE family metallo-endopeptidase [Myxococcales bacterium]|nr:ImmA/IrrE family metallo-endopeptidase [Myxococcales bacterium]